jgi:hypothetical protein
MFGKLDVPMLCSVNEKRRMNAAHGLSCGNDEIRGFGPPTDSAMAHGASLPEPQ